MDIRYVHGYELDMFMERFAFSFRMSTVKHLLAIPQVVSIVSAKSPAYGFDRVG